ncbi:hypothetical protein THRCLA_08349 [Thraustotheca clavata]|uniref:EF-hand domain-containing protein n=1 Tax=Thraustotheca clavata TaxID=74557 RepID=A0A1V9Z734_9STRA|nr:hypothetical protein THRCLA_08349 [Thraustotheca clavata]
MALYNFVNPRKERCKPAILDDITAKVLLKWAGQMNSTESIPKLWQALVQQSQSNAQVPYREAPNAVCTAIYFEILQQILQKCCPKASMVCDVVLGGILNCVYRTYDPAKPFYNNSRYADADDRRSREEVASQNDHHIRTIYLHFSQVESSSQKSVVMDLVKPVLSIDTMVEIWDLFLDAPAATTLRLPTASAVHLATLTKCFELLHDDEKRQLVQSLAQSIELRLNDLVGMKSDEIALPQPESKPTMLPHLLTKQSSMGRMSIHVRPTPEPPRISIAKPLKESQRRPSVLLPPNNRKPTRMSIRRKSILPHPPSVMSPEALLEMLPTVVTKDTLNLQDFPIPETKLKDFIEEVGDELLDIYTTLRNGEYRHQQSALQDLATLLERQFEKDASELDVTESNEMKKAKELNAVTTIVQLLKINSGALGSVLKQIPEILIDTVTMQQGILKYCMVHCPRVVQNFLHLETSPDILDTWHTTVKAHSIGLTLLWSSEMTSNVQDVTLSPLEAAYHWLNHHVSDAAKVMLLNCDLTNQLFVEMENETAKAKPGTINQFRLRNMLIELQDLPTFTQLRDIAQLKGFDAAIKHDVPSVVQMLGIILRNDEHLKNLVNNSIELTTALSMINRQALINLLTSDVTTWKPFFVNTIAAHDFLLADCLQLKTQHLLGGPRLMEAFNLVMAGNDGRWVGNDEQEKAQAVELISSEPLLNQPSAQSTSMTASVYVAKALNVFRMGRRWQPLAAQPLRHRRNPQTKMALNHIPWLWKTFDCERGKAPELTLRELKKLVFDIMIEKIKIDELELDGDDTIGDLSPFVCDYFVAKLQNRSLVGTQLQQVFRGCQTHISDPRIAFFAAACGIEKPLGRGILKSYLKSMGHLLLGVMRVFKPENSLHQLADGSCVVKTDAVLSASKAVFANCFSQSEVKDFQTRVLALRRVTLPDSYHNFYLDVRTAAVDLDEIMSLFLMAWQTFDARIDEQYISAFHRFRVNGDFIGIEEFVKIILHVTHGSISARDCRLIFYDMGEDMINLQTLLRLTQQYDLRLSVNHPPLPLSEKDHDEIRASLGQSCVLSFDDELKQLISCWDQIRPEIDKQLRSAHQNGSTKATLRRHKLAVEDSLSYLSSGNQTANARSAWDTFRSSVACLQSAVQAQKYFSTVYVQCHVRKWVSKIKKQHELQAIRDLNDGSTRISAQDLKYDVSTKTMLMRRHTRTNSIEKQSTIDEPFLDDTSFETKRTARGSLEDVTKDKARATKILASTLFSREKK